MGAYENPLAEPVIIGIDNGLALPTEFALHPSTPNPFNPITTIRYDLPEDSHVEITIYDLLGQHICTLVNANVTAGYQSVIWKGTNSFGRQVGSGLYIYQIKARNFIQTKKMILLK